MNYKTSEILQTFLNVLQIVENSFYQTGQIWAVRVRVRVRGRGGGLKCQAISRHHVNDG